MTSSILSIFLLFTVGTAPATHPDATELPKLRDELERLAIIWAPYGANYPGAADAKAKMVRVRTSRRAGGIWRKEKLKGTRTVSVFRPMVDT